MKNIETSEHKSLRTLSLGGGRQSSGLAALAVQGKIAMPDVVLFADTGGELPTTLKAVGIIFAKMSELGVICEIVSNGSILSDRGLASAPWYVWNTEKQSKGQLTRSCTDELKIVPLERRLRELAGCEPRKKMRAQQTVLLGFSIEEAHRVRPPRHSWLTLEHPLIDLNMTAMDAAIECYKVFGFVPEKSGCFCCPYTRHQTWNERRENDPELFQRAVDVDRRLANFAADKKRGIKYRPYVHPSLKPLSDCTHPQPTLFKQCTDGFCMN